MTHSTQLGFALDNFIMPFIVGAIRGVASIKVEDMADTLTDRPEPAHFTPEEIQWMKNTPVTQISMSDTYTENSSDFFDLLADGEPRLRISARSTGNGEFRGSIVQNVIHSAKDQDDGNLTLYDAFQSHISQVANNASFIYATNPAINEYLAALGFDPKSIVYKNLKQEYQKRVGFFGQSVYKSLDHLDALCEGNELNQAALDHLQIKLKEVFDAHPLPKDLIDFMEAFRSFEKQLNIIQEKARAFDAESEAGIAARQLHGSLVEARDHLISGEISIRQFKTSCSTACKTAEESVLKDHRGWKQVIATVFSAVASIATLGIANLISKAITGRFDFSKTNTDSINKVQDMKEKLKGLHTGIEPDEIEQDIESKHHLTRLE